MLDSRAEHFASFRAEARTPDDWTAPPSATKVFVAEDRSVPIESNPEKSFAPVDCRLGGRGKSRSRRPDLVS
jgi:hypothetical protein